MYWGFSSGFLQLLTSETLPFPIMRVTFLVFFQHAQETKGHHFSMLSQFFLLVRSGVLSTFALFECAPAKGKPIMTFSFALNYSVHELLLWV